MAILYGKAWPFFDKDPEDYGWTTNEVEGFNLLSRFEFAFARPVSILAGVIAVTLCAGVAAMIAAPHAIS